MDQSADRTLMESERELKEKLTREIRKLEEKIRVDDQQV